MSNIVHLRETSEQIEALPPPNTKRDKAYLAMLASVAPRYGYVLHADPVARRPMSLRMMWDLGFRHAAIEFEKQNEMRQRRAEWATRRSR